MTIEEALKNHNYIKVQLMLFLNDMGKHDIHFTGHSENCALGLWLCQALTQAPNCKFLNKIAIIHTDFHHCASNIVNLTHQGRKHDAIHLIKNDNKLKILSTKMADLVKRYKRQSQAVLYV